MSLPQPYYQRGPVTLYHGDCLELLPHLPRVDAVVTDPPYGLWKRLSGGTWGDKFGGGLHWDQKAALGIGEIVDRWPSIVWGGNYFGLKPSRCWLVWWKPDAVRTMADAELAWTNIDANVRVLRHSIAATNSERGLHETQKPIRVMEWSIGFISAANTILDPFLGSGTTAVACIRTGRQCIGIELEEKYCEIAAKRCDRELDQKRLPFDTPKPVEKQRELFAEVTA